MSGVISCEEPISPFPITDITTTTDAHILKHHAIEHTLIGMLQLSKVDVFLDVFVF